MQSHYLLSTALANNDTNGGGEGGGGRGRQSPTLSYEQPICRICHCANDSDLNFESLTSFSGADTAPPAADAAVANNNVNLTVPNLITPCFCSGSLRYVHHDCLQQWIRSSNHKYCELCKYHFKMTVKYKPFHQVGVEKKLFSHEVTVSCQKIPSEKEELATLLVAISPLSLQTLKQSVRFVDQWRNINLESCEDLVFRSHQLLS